MRKAPKIILITAAALIGTGTALSCGAWGGGRIRYGPPVHRELRLASNGERARGRANLRQHKSISHTHQNSRTFSSNPPTAMP